MLYLHYSKSGIIGFTSAVTILTTFFTGFRSSLRIVFEIPAAMLTAFAARFRCFFTILGEIS
ncbi:hypothetical protein SPAB_01516 [Salmonella enterica subsp. enterica serovar Paratyphi B str. SPB7]|uniref:Uncharacterized protein n=1 Tax=Salmonella paratyphi B (strain ATCC BAA-1250 / SPB7) TaxID=1016998 RepID=A0A6C6Z0V2_SALPB|nr:hypothetical protein SPAB_01516 [Salmonella enterica subsp. enterica serovar Paratyphi B str. SPB7]